MVSGEVLRRHDDLVKVGLHQLGYEVDLLEKVNVRGLKQKREVNNGILKHIFLNQI